MRIQEKPEDKDVLKSLFYIETMLKKMQANFTDLKERTAKVHSSQLQDNFPTPTDK